MRAYRAKKDEARIPVNSKYHILGFISSGTYGRVYKAQAKDANGNIVVTGPSAGVYAIKKFKPDKEGEVVTYTGISQSACREIAVCYASSWFVVDLNSTYLDLSLHEKCGMKTS
jgi:cyclin-dependent kinase 8/11